jgi:hypothetical protein
MSDKNKLSGEAIDLAIQKLQMQKSVDDTVVLEKGMVVDKRAMGGATTTEDDESKTDVGREQKNVKNPELGRLPQSNLSGNFATKYKEGNGLSDAEKENAKNPEPDRGLSKAVEKEDEKKDEKSEESADSKMEKAFPEDLKKKDDESSDSDVKKAVAPAEESSASNGSESGAPRLGKVVNKGMSKAIGLIASAQKHLTKAFEDGSDKDLDITGRRLISAKEEILKSIGAGEKISNEVVESLDKSARYFGKSLETYEKEDAEGHIKAIGKTQKHMTKAIEAYQSFEKSLEAKPVETPRGELKFVRQNGKVVLEMNEDEAALVRKSLQKDNLYKSLENDIPEESKKTLDASPMLKSLFSAVVKSNDNLRDVVADRSEKDRDFRKSVTEALEVLGKGVKQAMEGVEKISSTPNLRKSIVSVVESPKTEAAEPTPGTMDKQLIEVMLEKGLKAQLIDVQTFLAWDVDKAMDVVPEKYIAICKSIEARIGK